MITREVLIGVLRSHSQRRNIRDLHTHCLCGWSSDRIPGVGQHVQHQADAVLAAIDRLQPKRITYDDDLSADVLWSVRKDAVSNEWPFEDTLDTHERGDQ